MIGSRRVRLAAAAVAASAALCAWASGAGATTGVTANRLAGSDRYGTAQTVATDTFTSAPEVVLASGLNYPDALAANYLAGRIHGPILLTDPNSLSSETVSAMKSLGTTGVDVVGGPSAVSSNVISQLKADGYQVNQIYGSDRYGTAEAIAELFPASFVGTIGPVGPTAIVTTGLNFADALAAGPISYAQSVPLLLTDPSSLSSETQTALTNLGIKSVLLLGGTAAVSANVQDQIQNMGISVTRIAGADRTDTAAQLATQIEYSTLGWVPSHVNLARGDDYPDALAGGPHGGVSKSAIVLTEDPNTLGSYTTTFLQDESSTVASIDVFGGPDAVSDATVAAAQQAAG